MPEDRELLLAYSRRGDVPALSELVRRHSLWMQALLRGMLPSAADAEDAFQDAWMRIVKSAARYRGGSVRAYLASAARTAALDRLRKAGRTVSLDAGCCEDGDPPAALDVPDGRPTPSESLQRRTEANAVRRAVRMLPEGPRQVLLMRIEGELTFREIASELGVPVGTALTWMRTATKRVSQIVGGET